MCEFPVSTGSWYGVCSFIGHDYQWDITCPSEGICIELMLYNILMVICLPITSARFLSEVLRIVTKIVQ